MEEYRFQSDVESVVRGLPKGQQSALREYARLFTVSNGWLAYQHGGEGRLSPRFYGRLLERDDEIVGELVMSSLEKSGFQYTFTDNARNHATIAKMIGPFHETLRKQAPNGSKPDLLRDISLGLVGVHAVIWTPEHAKDGPAATVFEASSAAYLKDIVQPLAREANPLRSQRRL